jgi:hypothetical protein
LNLTEWLVDAGFWDGFIEVVKPGILPVILGIHDYITKVVFGELAQEPEAPRMTSGCKNDASPDALRT